MNHLDAYWAKQVPVSPAPAYSGFERLTAPGHRIIVARNGTFAEVVRPWLYARIRIGANNGFAMPFGELNEVLEVTQRIPRDLLATFQAQALSAFPNETAAWVVWNEMSGYRLTPVAESEASVGHVRFDRPILDDGEHLVLDLHSHGALPAFFSATDDEDDLGEIKLAAVVGSLAETAPTWVLRLCLLGMQIFWPDQHTLFTE